MAARRALGDSCATCEFSLLSIVPFDSDGNERDVAVRYCHRYPPHSIVVAGEVLRHDQQVDDDEWCGEFVPAAHEPDEGAAR